MPAEDEERRELLCELGIALNTAGDTERADATLREATEIAARTGDRRIELRARIELAAAHLLDEQGSSAQQLFDLADAATPVFESLGDNRSLGRTWMLTGWVQGGMYCHNAVWEESAERALGYYRRAGAPVATCVGQIAAALYFGPTSATTAVARCFELLDHEVEDRAGEANVLAHLGGLQAMLGGFDAAREQLARARQIYDDLGQPTAVARTCAPLDAVVARLAGDPETAARALTASCEALQAMRNWTPLSTQAAELADALCTLERLAEAQVWIEIAKAHVPAADASAQFTLKAADARLLARTQDPGAAAKLARDARAIANETDALNQRAAVHLALAEILTASSAPSEAALEVAEAVRLFEEKGNAAAVALVHAEQRAAAVS